MVQRKWHDQPVRARKRRRCRHHDWESGAWGVIIGASRCLSCGELSRTEHFSRAPRKRGRLVIEKEQS